MKAPQAEIGPGVGRQQGVGYTHGAKTRTRTAPLGSSGHSRHAPAFAQCGKNAHGQALWGLKNSRVYGTNTQKWKSSTSLKAFREDDGELKERDAALRKTFDDFVTTPELVDNQVARFRS
jgi:hypothetical protein